MLSCLGDIREWRPGCLRGASLRHLQMLQQGSQHFTLLGRPLSSSTEPPSAELAMADQSSEKVGRSS